MLGLQRFKTCIDKVPTFVDIHFTGYGEPWLNPWCTEMILYAHEQGHKLAVSTTLVGITLDDLQTVSRIPWKVFWVHLPSAGHYENIPITDRYLKLLDLLVDMATNEINVSWHWHGGELHPLLTFLEAYIHPESYREMDLIDRARNVVKKKKFPDRITLSMTSKGEIKCGRIHQNVLLPSGDVRLCCMDYGGRHVIGNLLRDDYKDLQQSDEFKSVRRGLIDENASTLCRTCSWPQRSKE